MNAITIPGFHSLPDEDLMELFQGGYDEAFTVIVNRYRDRLHQFVYRYTHNHLDSEDLTQETFMRVFRSRNSYERIARFSTWLYTIATNLIRSQYKRSQKMVTQSLTATDETDQDYVSDLLDPQLATDDHTHYRMTVDQLRKALELVPADFRQLVVMRDVEQLSYEEITEVTGLPMGTVKSRINRGRVRLQELMGTYLAD